MASGVPTRANTLSWQQRPSRNGPSGPRSRPQSGLVNQSAITPHLQKMEASLAKDDEQVSRDDISKKLAQKDAAWFKQTQDRGIGSAAYRRNQETEVTKLPSSVERRRLPGLEHEINPVLENTSSLPERIQPNSRSKASEQMPPEEKPTTDVSLPSSISHSSTYPSLQDIRLPPPSGAGAGGSDALGRVPALTTSQDRVSPERTQRSPSPTKGLGGFVQSAMLKRSDSVSKRWSAQATPGLSRGNSITNVRSSNASQYLGNYRAPAESRPESISRDNSPVLTSRPTSSHGSTLQREVLPPSSESKAAADRQPPKDDTEASFDAKTNGHQPSLRDSLPSSSSLPTLTSPPTSPSKRWSPTKSSWLENAINKPESPKPKFTVPQQPSWMADLNKAKQQKAEAEPVKEGSPHKVSTTGFLRSPPMGASSNNSGISGLPLGFSAGVNAKESLKQSTTGSKDHTDRHDQVGRADTPGIRPMGGSGGSATSDRSNPGVTASKQKDSVSPRSNRSSVAPSTSPEPVGLLKSHSVTPRNQSSTTSPRLSKELNPAPGNEEAEFKNVFGKLRRTQIKNYVAPDELKDNILRGKAGLNITGGPKKTERVDELKESILKKKQEMKEGQAKKVPAKPAPSSEQKSMPLKLSHGQGLSRDSSSAANEDLSVAAKAQLPETAPKVVAKNSPVTLPKPAETENYAVESPVTQDTSKIKDSLVVSTAVTKTAQESMVPQKPSVRPQPESAAPKAQAKLGNAFSASLAGLITRRPSPLNHDTDALLPQTTQSEAIPADIKPQSPGKQLEHITKSRAKGPKRRAPTSKTSETLPAGKQAETICPTTDDSWSEPFTKPPEALPPAPKLSEPQIAKSEKTYGFGIDTQQARANDLPIPQSKPEIPIPSSSIRSSVFPLSQEQRIGSDDRASNPSPAPNLRGSSPAPPKSPLMRTGPPRLSTSSKPSTPHTSKPMSPPLPTKPATLSQPPISPKAHKPTTSANLPSSSDTPTSLTAPLPSDKPVRALLAAHLASPTTPTPTITINTPSILSQLSSPPKIKTLRKSISELGAHGALHSLPQSLEHILFSAHLYLCTHVFGTPDGTRITEVYLWHGLEVPPAYVEDAQLFARRAAKDTGGKLVVIKQGRETAEFLQALGGILITRHGFSSRSTSPVKASATYMLRGRQYMGQITFDEVDFLTDELCSGFPHLISAPFGKLYLWKGCGAGADELGCARLIGMDLGLTGEIEEVDEGKESAAFWGVFSLRSRIPNTSITGVGATDKWNEKSSCENYIIRLFSVDLETPRPKSSASIGGSVSGFGRWVRQGSIPNLSSPTPEPEAKNPVAQIREISPFAQDDLVAGGVYVLDTFCELYV